jgi:hypothetical protein
MQLSRRNTMKDRHLPSVSNHPWALTRILLAAVLLGAPASSLAAQGLGGTDSARGALALMVSNQNRCLGLANRYLSRIKRNYSSNLARAEAGVEYTESSEAHREIVAVSGSLRLTSRLLGEGGGSVEPDVEASLYGMFRSQERLFGLITHPGGWQTPEGFEEAVAEERFAFSEAEAEASAALPMSSQERHEILQRYQSMLNRNSRTFEERHYDPLVREKSPQEQVKEKAAYEDWLAEQERLEAEHVRKLQEQQEAKDQRDSSGAAAPRPSVGLKVLPPEAAAPPPPPPPAVPRADLGAMKSWHSRYSSKVYPVKMAISQYLQVRNDGTPVMIGRSCTKMSQAVRSLLADATALRSPDAIVRNALETAMNEFQKGADLCRAQPESEQVQSHISAAEKALATAAAVLSHYQLTL